MDKSPDFELFTRICAKASAYNTRFSGVFHIFTRGGATVLYNHVENVEKMWILGKTKLTGCYIADFYQHNSPLLSGKLLRLLNLNFLKKLLSTLEFDGGSVNFR